MREAAAGVGRRILRRVEGRIHYHVIGRTGRQSRRRKRRRARANIEADGARAAGQVVAHRIVARQRDQCWIDLDQSDGQIADAAGESAAFLSLALAGAAGTALVWLAMISLWAEAVCSK